jgi:hypothetical protein
MYGLTALEENLFFENLPITELLDLKGLLFANPHFGYVAGLTITVLVLRG